MNDMHVIIVEVSTIYFRYIATIITYLPSLLVVKRREQRKGKDKYYV